MAGPVADPNPGAVFAGGPDRVTGACLSAVAGTALPVSITATLDGAFADHGYLNADGLQLSQDMKFDDIKEWGGRLIRSIQNDFSGTFSWTFIETNKLATKAVFGEANVSETAATVSTGTLLTIVGSAEQADPRSWVFRMKDGPRRIMVVVPSGQVTKRGDIKYTRTGAVEYPVEMKALPDDNGNAFTIYTDDGVYTGAPIVATGATAGVPGHITPTGAVLPANLAALTGKTASPTTAWTTGQYVVLGDGSIAHWNSTAWVQGSAAGVA